MRLNDSPERECPSCEGHPILVYEDSVGPAGVIGQSGRVEGGTTLHFYRCALCGRKFRASGTGQLAASTQDRKLPVKDCFNCGAAMRVGMVAKEGSDPSAGPRTFGGSYQRVDMSFVWRCDACGATDNFHYQDVLGFN